MPSVRQPRTPKYRLHRPTGLAVVTLCGKDRYLGKHGTKESQQAYRLALAEWLAAGGPEQPKHAATEGLLVADVIARYWLSLEARDKERVERGSHDRVRVTMQTLDTLYGKVNAKEFGPKSLRVVQQHLVRAGLCRGVVNQRVQFIRRMFRWAVAEELVPRDLAHALEAVEHLRRSEYGVAEGRKIGPVVEAHMRAVLPHVARQVAAMIELQWWAGMRPGEAAQLRPADLERTDKLWIYRPQHHKTEHHGKPREIAIGPRAQAVLLPFLNRVPAPDPEKPLFSPRDAEAEHALERRAARLSPMTPSQEKRRRKKRPERAPGEAYDVASYRRAISRGVQSSNAETLRAAILKALQAVVPDVDPQLAQVPIERLVDGRGASRIAEPWLRSRLAKDLATEQVEHVLERLRRDLRDLQLVPCWHPHQLRHSAATRIRKEAGFEAARVVLGHASPGITEVYAEIDHEKARKAMERYG